MNAIEPWIATRAKASPNPIALRFGGQRLTWADLARESEALARRLAFLGVEAGDRVAVHMRPHPRFVALLHACQRLGAALVPINLRLSRDEVTDLVARADPRVALVDATFGGDAPLSATTLDVFDELDEVPTPRSLRLSDRVDADATLTIVFTSGSTGSAKGVELASANHAASALASRRRLGHSAKDTWLATLPLFHVGGLAILVRSVLDGSTVTLAEGFDEESVAGAITGGSATIVPVVPTMLTRVLARLAAPPALRFRCLLVGGAALSPALAARALEVGLALAPTYGLTEACSQVCTAAPGGDEAAHGLVGRPLDTIEVRIEGADESGLGEIAVRGPTVMRGYFRDPGATADALRDGWLRTRDLGSLDGQGRLRLAGRRDDTIVTGGENVHPTEVEAVLDAHPDVAESVVVGVDDAEWGQRIVALVTPKGAGAGGRRGEPGVAESSVADAAALRAWCRDKIAGFKIPREVQVVASLPRGATGKIDRRAARRLVSKP